jgi:hypothetical protein
MKTANVMFSMVLAMTAGCATTLDRLPAVESGGGSDSNAALSAVDGACFVTGGANTIAPKAQVRPGLEIVSTSAGLALGFGSSPHDAVAVKIDPQSGRAIESSSRHSSDLIRRVTPRENGTGVDAAIDTDCKTNLLRNAMTISAKDPFVVGTVDSNIAWASCESATPRALWHVDGAVQDLRGIELADGGFAIVFRQAGSVWFGRLDSEKNVESSLKKIAERAELRSPVLAESGGNVLVAWSEENQDKWSLGAASVAPCGRATPVQLAYPTPGTESDAIQPALVGVDNGNFLLVWTEGSAYTHQVRAVTIESHGRPVGPVLAVSSGAESGWGRPALTADGRGAVVYLVPTDTGFAVASTPISCRLSPAQANRVAARL